MISLVVQHLKLAGLLVAFLLLSMLPGTRAILLPGGNMGHNPFLRVMPAGAMQPDPEPESESGPSGPATYWVTFSTRIRPGIHLPVTVHLVNDDAVSEVSVTLRNSSDESVIFAEAPPTTVKGADGAVIIKLEIPRNLKRPGGKNGWFKYCLKVTGDGAVTFNQSHQLTLYEKSFSIFVQTDKAIYKPGETVKFRALAMNPNLTVLQEQMDIFVRDPQGNGIRQWKNVTGFDNTGVVERKIPTSADPPMGDWRIDVTVLGETETKTFTIDKYVLPKFETTLELPDKFLVTESEVKGKAISKYTFGKPLTEAEVTITLKQDYYNTYGRNVTLQPQLQQSGKVNRNGEFEFSFSKSEIEQLLWESRVSYYVGKREDFKLTRSSVLVIANVTDTLSDKKMGAVSKFQFKEKQAIVKFLQLTPNTFKPGLKYTAYVSVTQYNEALFDNYKDINVNFNITIQVPRLTTTTTTTTTTTISPDSKEKKPGKGDNHKNRYVSPEVTNRLSSFSRTLPATGLLVVDVDVPSTANSMDIKVDVLGSTDFERVNKAKSPSSSYIQILAQTSNPKVGHTAQVTINATEPVGKLYYQLYSKGLLLKEAEAEAVDKWRQNFTVSFPVTASMAPTCRVLAFHVKDSGEVVADTMSLKIDASSEVHVNVSYNEEKVKPGEEVQLKVQARANSTVFLLGIDKSVKLLKSGNDITQDMVEQQLAQYDFGSGFIRYWRFIRICGWPYLGQGQDANSVFNEANVAILTDGYVEGKRDA